MKLDLYFIENKPDKQRFGSVIFLTEPDPTQKKLIWILGEKGKDFFSRFFFTFRMIQTFKKKSIFKKSLQIIQKMKKKIKNYFFHLPPPRIRFRHSLNGSGSETLLINVAIFTKLDWMHFLSSNSFLFSDPIQTASQEFFTRVKRKEVNNFFTQFES